MKPFISTSQRSILVKTKGTKPMYDIFTKNESSSACLNKWSTICNCIETKDWLHIFSMPFHITPDANLQWFQYK